MFTGIIQSLGTLDIVNLNKNIFNIKTDLDLSNCLIGTSICCDGVCLTVIDIKNNNSSYIFSVNIGEETIKRTNINLWKIGKKINLEKSLKVGDELSGHFVYGHIDLNLSVNSIIKLENSWMIEISLINSYEYKNLQKFIVEKGSISINGISLTVANVFKESFNVSIIPHTYFNTNLSLLSKKDLVNIEFDPLARYISLRYDN